MAHFQTVVEHIRNKITKTKEEVAYYSRQCVDADNAVEKAIFQGRLKTSYNTLENLNKAIDHRDWYRLARMSIISREDARMLMQHNLLRWGI